MKSLISAALALGLTAALSTAALAECPYSNTTAQGKSMTPIVTADTTVTTDEKG